MKAIELLADFIRRAENKAYGYSEWLYGADMEVYVRHSVPRYLGDVKCRTLDIANITVYQKGQGRFTEFLSQVHAMNPWPATYIESVLQPRLLDFLVRQGFTKHDDHTPPCFFKFTANSDLQR